MATTQFTGLLQAWRGGDESALNEIVARAYRELRRIAGSLMGRERPGHTLQATALVNEVFLKLAGGGPGIPWKDRAHFVGICARQMRHILIDHARKEHRLKRGGNLLRLTWNDLPGIESPGSDLLALDTALSDLARLDARKAAVVELRFFGGLDINETAEVLQASPSTVTRDWSFAKTWLRQQLRKERVDEPHSLEPV